MLRASRNLLWTLVGGLLVALLVAAAAGTDLVKILGGLSLGFIAVAIGLTYVDRRRSEPLRVLRQPAPELKAFDLDLLQDMLGPRFNIELAGHEFKVSESINDITTLRNGQTLVTLVMKSRQATWHIELELKGDNGYWSLRKGAEIHARGTFNSRTTLGPHSYLIRLSDCEVF